MSLCCSKCDHYVSMVSLCDLDDGSRIQLCNRCEIELEDCKWELPETAEEAKSKKIYVVRGPE